MNKFIIFLFLLAVLFAYNMRNANIDAHEKLDAAEKKAMYFSQQYYQCQQSYTALRNGLDNGSGW